MRKAHVFNFWIIAIIFSLFYILDFYLTQNNIKININFRIDDSYKIGLFIGMYLIFIGLSIYNFSNKVFNLFVKREKSVDLLSSKIYLLISSILVGATILVLEFDFYYYFGSIIVAYLFYIGFLYLLDYKYIRKSQENVIEVNEELVNDFIEILGGKDNIILVTYEYSRLKVELKNIKLLNIERLKELGAQGSFISGNKLQAKIGNNADELERAINTFLSI